MPDELDSHDGQASGAESSAPSAARSRRSGKVVIQLEDESALDR
jgi:hypothetical protein